MVWYKKREHEFVYFIRKMPTVRFESSELENIAAKSELEGRRQRFLKKHNCASDQHFAICTTCDGTGEVEEMESIYTGTDTRGNLKYERKPVMHSCSVCHGEGGFCK